MSDTDEHQSSAAKAQLKALKARLEDSEHWSKADFDGHRQLVNSAIISSNGAIDKIAAMAETQAQLVAFIVQQSQREPARLAEAFAHAHVCLFKKGEDGEFVDPPWQPAIETAIAAAFRGHALEPQAPESSAEITLPVLGKIFSGRGKASVVFVGGLSVVVVLGLMMGGLLYWQSARFADLVDRRFEAAARERSMNDGRAVGRAADIQNTIGDE